MFIECYIRVRDGAGDICALAVSSVRRPRRPHRSQAKQSVWGRAEDGDRVTRDTGQDVTICCPPQSRVTSGPGKYGANKPRAARGRAASAGRWPVQRSAEDIVTVRPSPW